MQIQILIEGQIERQKRVKVSPTNYYLVDLKIDTQRLQIKISVKLQ